MRRDRLVTSLVGVVALGIAILVLAPLGALGQGGHSAAPQSVVGVGEDLVLSHDVQGSVEVLGGSVTLDAVVHGDLIAFGTKVDLRPGARIDGDLFVLGGSVRGAVASIVKGEIFAPGSMSSALAGAAKGGRTIYAAASQPFSLVSLALKISLLLVWFVVAVVVTLGQSREVRASSLEVRASPFHSFFLGLVAFTSFLLTAIVFSYLIPYIVGLLLLVVLALFAIVTKVYGMIAVFHAIGTMVAGPRTRAQAGARRWFRGDLSMVIVGLVLLGVLRLIPVLGNVLWMTASLVGVGVALATRFGRRDPAFLAWRPAEERVRRD